MKHTPMQTDYLVIGSGIAGLSYALEMAQYGQICVITKKDKAESNTNYAQGGIAAVMSPIDSFHQHVEDTLTAGAGLCDSQVVQHVVQEGPKAIARLLAMGARFTQQDGGFHLGREGGHSANRIIHAADTTGREIERVLLQQLDKHPNITLLEHHYASDLLCNEQGECIGVLAIDTQANRLLPVIAKATLLASGGSGQLFQHTTNPLVATGDGVAMAYRAGAKVANMEFVQFHPTSLYHQGESVFLISEAVRGAGAFLINKTGQRFMMENHPLGDLAPRDIVARGIDEQLKLTGEPCVYLDATYLPKTEIQAHFPMIAKTCQQYGVDIFTQPIPVVPAAHYQCGGVMTDAKAQTSIPRLLACGEVAYTGLHGANRLASNSLLEALVYAEAAAQTARHMPALEVLPEVAIQDIPHSEEAAQDEHYRQQLRRLMSQKVGIMRREELLQKARKERAELEQQWQQQKSPVLTVAGCELRNLFVLADLTITSALMRRESRGLHSIKDYPQTEEKYRHPTVLCAAQKA